MTPQPDVYPLALTRAAAVADELRRRIRSGEIPAGTRLRQMEVASWFKVSTTPVREAFTSLASEGFVRQDAHRGVVVFVPSHDDLVQNYEIRLALEPLATEIAASTISAEELDQLDALLVEMRASLLKDRPRYGAVLNPRFHAAIYAAAQRPRLFELIQGLRDASSAYVQLLALRPQPPEYLEAAQTEHEDIVAALRANAPKRAAKAMTKHLQHNRDQILAALDATA
ncbi:MAG: transcriptional regulator, GntR family [Conexibacter sp.]|nr:transcriptional regulator, GntR family [Conexibacter sp.]